MPSQIISSIQKPIANLSRIRTAKSYKARSSFREFEWSQCEPAAQLRTLRTTAPFQHELEERRRNRTPGRVKRIIVAVTGATGAPLAVSVLECLRRLGVETHLVLSTWGASTLKYELKPGKNTPNYLASLASFNYSPRDVSASLSSGSFRTDGMIVVPCSMKTLAGIRMGYDNDLITRAASVTLKERRRLVLVARETPLSSIHLENMLDVTKAGAIIFPPVMAFYTRPKDIDSMVDQSVRRMVDALDLNLEEHENGEGRWNGFDWDSVKTDS
jgi:4-hydroxy-3-polyprenylbenzoate decarboxylase